MEEITTAVRTNDVPDFRLIARNPQELEASRQQLITFFDAKMKALDQEMNDLDANMAIALKFPINTRPLKAQMNRVASRYEYYRKAKAAVEAGFHIIPNFDADVFALRTTQKTYHGPPREGAPQWKPSVPDVSLRPAPLGEGRYVDNRPLQSEAEYDRKKPDGTTEKRVTVWGSGLDDQEIDFPFVFARPEVLTATQQVMAAKIFDELATLPSRRPKGDPMVVGIIKESKSWRAPRMTFLVVWFLDTNTL